MTRRVHGYRSMRLKVCPFCGAEAVFGVAENGMHNVRCTDGHAMSPDMDTPEQALTWWNRRYVGPQFPTRSKVRARKI